MPPALAGLSYAQLRRYGLLCCCLPPLSPSSACCVCCVCCACCACCVHPVLPLPHSNQWVPCPGRFAHLMLHDALPLAGVFPLLCCVASAARAGRCGSTRPKTQCHRQMLHWFFLAVVARHNCWLPRTTLCTPLQRLRLQSGWGVSARIDPRWGCYWCCWSGPVGASVLHVCLFECTPCVPVVAFQLLSLTAPPYPAPPITLSACLNRLSTTFCLAPLLRSRATF